MTTIKTTLAILALLTFTVPAFAQETPAENETLINLMKAAAFKMCAGDVEDPAKPKKPAREKGVWGKAKDAATAVKDAAVEAGSVAWESHETGKSAAELLAEHQELKCRQTYPLIATYVDSPKKFFLGLSVYSTLAWAGLSFLTVFCLLTKLWPSGKSWKLISLSAAIGRAAVFLLDDQVFHKAMSQYWLIPIFLIAMLIPFGYSKVKLGSWTKFFGTRHPPRRTAEPTASPAKPSKGQCPQCGKPSLYKGVCTAGGDCTYEEGVTPEATQPVVAAPPPKREYSLPPPEHRHRRRV